MDIQDKDIIFRFTKDLTLLYLSIDKNDNSINYFKKIFKKMIFSNNEIDVFKKFNESEISVLIADTEIPELEVFSLITRVKKINPKLITIIYSHNEDKEVFIKAISCGVNGYLSKPLDENQFLAILSKFIETEKIKVDKFFLKKQYDAIIDENTIVSKTNRHGIITFANENFCKSSEYTSSELIGKSHNIVRHPENPKELFKDLWNTIKVKKEPWTGVLKNLSKSGKPYFIKTTIKPIFDLNGEITEYISIRSNVNTVMSDKKQLIEKINEKGLHLLILIQIEDFNILDKFYNMLIVDKIEKIFGFNLLTYLPNSYIFDTIYYLGNGQFALLTEFFDFLSTHTNINDYLNSLVKNVKESRLIVDEIEYDLNVIVSYSFGREHLYEDSKYGLDEAIKKSEIIKYSNDFSIKEQIEAKKNMEVIKMVKIALENYNVISYFQPIINNKTKKIEKYESLVRIIDENQNILSPHEFLDISKKGNYYNKITHRVLENSFKILKQISTKISINLSSLDIEKEETRTKLFQLLDEYESDRHRVIFELLEDENVKDFQVIKAFIKKVKSMGVMIAIDDFGAGYSNFERLLEFNPDILKIDGKLIKNIANDNYSRNIVETIVTFTKKQNIITIAEFVENEEIFNILDELGVDYSQGYYFGKPENMNF
ncbi:EAL domain-containing protein [Arcobacter defluvii]|uniref:PAS sensor-containing diguanylate phosphodiesterase n=1 Tax=Arcobacter defluvii TaxID=873191 RepID=A0AAE7BGS2_9BACT|nr:EAL domain-containing protein [Arcobacter defluvii]QKF77432.1 PAS sensor-containing diguanylate phosphodiesterase [Arcobacter defluvii]RXI32109.1 diguanylate cyclase [Arcobacter defluvii]